jgi:hypothetical protein
MTQAEPRRRSPVGLTGGHSETSRRVGWGRYCCLLVLLALVAGCARAVALELPVQGEQHVPGFRPAEDVFAFRNDIRARNPDKPDLYANYCFVLARSVRQFHAFARFDPDLPRLTADRYRERIREVVARSPWKPPVPRDDRVVIPGYRNLHDFSRDQELLVKETLGGRFWTWMHWTNWRVTMRVSGEHQERVAEEIVDGIDAGRLVQLLVTNWPAPELNHTVVAYAYRATQAAIDFTVYDPNDPSSPWLISFDRERQHFWATRMYAVRPGEIRAFRMYYSPFL